LYAEIVKTVERPVTLFKILIPAHNEELLLGRLLKSIGEQDYPKDMYDVLVIADNCTDHTAVVARCNGASTIERIDLCNTGKGHAIKYGLECIASTEYDAVFVVDADSIIASSALSELDRAIQHGARIMQCYNGVINANDSWFTRLMDVSRSFGNEVLGPAKEKVGLSSHLMGNGMCFVRDVIIRYGWDAFTVGEDWEYYAKVVLQGERVAFANKARVYHNESVNLRQATTQRLRWSGGRFAVAAKHGARLFFNGMSCGSLMKIDAALPLLFPNPSLGISLTILMLLLCLLTPGSMRPGNYIAWFLLLSILQFGFFLVGIGYVKDKRKKLLAVVLAPAFLICKSGIDLLSVAGVGRKSWVRTERRL